MVMEIKNVKVKENIKIWIGKKGDNGGYGEGGIGGGATIVSIDGEEVTMVAGGGEGAGYDAKGWDGRSEQNVWDGVGGWKRKGKG